MFVFAAVVPTIVLLDDLGLLVEELGLLVLVLFHFFIHKLLATVIASQNPLDGE